jgi:3-deoxy-D-manno-octulosonic-acid transferase
MPYLIDLLYLALVVLLSPFVVFRAWRRGNRPAGLRDKLFGRTLVRSGATPCVWFHGVSVGEIHLLRQVLARFRLRYPDWDVVVSTTTDTGFEEARKCFPAMPVVWWPLDFSWAVRRALRDVRPNLVVLAEGELWPNFLVPVAVINGRLSPRSLRRYRKLAPLVRPLYRRLSLCAAQTEEYAAAYRALGVAADRVTVTGSVKFDGVTADRDNLRTAEMRRRLSVQAGDLVVVAGSTQAPEEEYAVRAFRTLRQRYPSLRLFLVPRQKDRVEEVARLLQGNDVPYVRRSALTGPVEDRRAIVLVDTIGELGAVWGIADVAFVGGSLDGRRGGQNMIEPAAYGAAVVFGPHVWNFRDTAARLLEVGGAVQVADEHELHSAVERLLGDPAERARMGDRARAFVHQQQGATDRTLALLDPLLASVTARPRAA